tara:strand:+ start:686 stop:1915 length:1230 start_codon:yes stop_codon:yes gene_type:complete
MSLYAERIDQFNKSVEDAKEHAENIANQVENLRAIQRDPARSMFDKVNDSVSGVAGAIGQAAQIYHTYKHGKVLTFLEQHDINKALGKVGKGGLKNAGNETLNAIDQARNAPLSGVAPNSEAIQLPEAKELVSSLKGRIIGNESEGASPADLGQLVGRTSALPDKADNLSSDAVNQVLTAQAKPEELQNTGTAIKTTPQGQKLFTAEGTDPERAGPSDLSADARQTLSEQFTKSPADEEDNPFGFFKMFPEERALQAAPTAEDKGASFGQELVSEATQEALSPIKINTNALSGGEKVVENLAKSAGDLGGDVDNAVNVAGTVAKAAGSTLGKIAGEGGGNLLGDTIATSMEAVAPETGPIAPLVAAVGGLVALGSSLAGLFHKNKPPPKVEPVAPPAAAQVGANLSVAK